nr:uncharacterized protein LOC123288173 isoform X1 [Equus asinus]
MCTIVPDFQLPLLSGDCLTLNSELHQANFKRSKREAPACFWLFQGCGPIKVRLLSLMVEDEEHKASLEKKQPCVAGSICSKFCAGLGLLSRLSCCELSVRLKVLQGRPATIRAKGAPRSLFLKVAKYQLSSFMDYYLVAQFLQCCFGTWYVCSCGYIICVYLHISANLYVRGGIKGNEMI